MEAIKGVRVDPLDQGGDTIGSQVEMSHVEVIALSTCCTKYGATEEETVHTTSRPILRSACQSLSLTTHWNAEKCLLVLSCHNSKERQA